MLLRDIPKKVMKGAIALYAYALSPLMRGKCRYHPTCSAYAMEAIDRHGAVKGFVMALKRLSRCHPWSRGPMLDPVPQSIDWAGIIGYNHAKPRKKDKNHAKP